MFTRGACGSSPGHIAVITLSPSTSASVAVSFAASRIHRLHPASRPTHRCRASQRINYIDINFKTRSFRTIFILFVVFVVCWLPFSVAILVANIRASTMTQRDCYVMASTTMTQQNCNVMAITTIIPKMGNIIADTTMTEHKYYAIEDTTMKQNNYDVMVDKTMKQNNHDVNEQAMPSQNSNFYVTGVLMMTEKSNFHVIEDEEVTEYNCNVTDETTMTKRDNSDVTVALKQSSELQGAAMVALVTLCLGCANCAINPFVFWFQIGKYRSACLEYLPCTAANSSNCTCYCENISTNAIDICGIDVDSLPPRLSFRTRRQIHPDAVYKCTDENEDTPAT